jgi:NADH-quinone oxidoreductase subunit F
VNNVETLMNVPDIVLAGGNAFRSLGTEQSTGTKLFCLSGNVHRPGLYEVAFGATTNDLITMAGGVVGELAAVLAGGAAGSFLTHDQLDIPLTFEAAAQAGISLGSGAVVVFNTEADMPSIVSRVARFFAEESCGLCVPCRVGTVRQEEVLEKMAAGDPPGDALDRLERIDKTLRDASICGLGQLAGTAVQSAIRIGLIGGDR